MSLWKVKGPKWTRTGSTKTKIVFRQFLWRFLLSIFFVHDVFAGKITDRKSVNYDLQGSTSSKIFGAFNALGTIAFSFGDAMLPEIQVTYPNTNLYLCLSLFVTEVAYVTYLRCELFVLKQLEFLYDRIPCESLQEEICIKASRQPIASLCSVTGCWPSRGTGLSGRRSSHMSWLL